MNCSFGHPLSDEQVGTAQDDRATLEIQQHLQACPGCTALLNTDIQFESVLHRRLYRFDCISPQQLGDYYLGMLHASSQRLVLQHLERCILCAQELEDLCAWMDHASVSRQPTIYLYQELSSAARRVLRVE